jgi:hypothetical protein
VSRAGKFQRGIHAFKTIGKPLSIALPKSK